MGLYYFNRLKPRLDKDMGLMTLAITIGFIVRSSSLIGWVPLALAKIISAPHLYFMPILLAGLLVALPALFLSFCLDSLHFGKPQVPQINFVYYNVFENLSKYFGV